LFEFKNIDGVFQFHNFFLKFYNLFNLLSVFCF